jgi:pheromone shutdown-related protein TraB
MVNGKLLIVGTSHVAKDSIAKVKKTIEEEKPDIVAVELDHARIHSLFSKQKPKLNFSTLRIMGITGFAFFAIGGFLQRKIGKVIGTTPGEEMKTAVIVAKQNGIKIALIDQPINITMNNLSRIGFGEKLKLVRDFVLGIVGLKKEKELFENIDLSKTPENDWVELAMKLVKKRYPRLYKVLVTDRDMHMAMALTKLISMNPGSKVVAVLGAGHAKEVARLVSGKSSQTKDLKRK